MSLREMPPEQAIRTDRWRRLRFVPLSILLILAMVATVVGFVVERDQEADEAADAAPAPIADVPLEEVGAPGLPASCRPRVDPPTQQPWLAGDAASAERIWQSHADEMTQAYITGQGGWVDWGDIQAQNFSQVIGRRVLTDQEADRWHEYFKSLRDALAEKDIPFYVAITPAKFNVYPQFLPEWAQELRGSGPLDQLIAGYPDLPIIDLRQPLRAASTDESVYSRVNSHWTDYGSYLGWKSIAECIATTTPEVGSIGVPPIDGVQTLGGFNEWESYGVTNPSPDWTVPKYSEELKSVRIARGDGTIDVVPGTERTGLEMLPAETTNSAAQSEDSALVLRDSFGSSMSIPLQQSFATTWQVRHNIDAGPEQQPDILALAEEHDPDVVILQLAERHLNFPPSQ